MFKAAIIGGTGYGGAELCRQLLEHDQIELTRVCAIDNVGTNIGEVHYNLFGRTDLVFEELSPTDAAAGVDVVFLGLPHTVSSSVVPELMATGVKVVDMSGDFRLRDLATYEKYYNTTHPCPQFLDGTFVYGLPELNREEIQNAQYVASPGCFATAIAVGLLPFAKAGLLNGPVHTVAATGSSGSGAYAKAGTHHPVRAANLKIYSPLNHRHQPEVEQTLAQAGAGDECRIEFVPVSVPLVRGILANSMFEIPKDVTHESIAAMYRETFEGSPFVKIVEGRFPEAVAIKWTNYIEVGFSLGKDGADSRTVVATSSLDNLVKGGAGQSVQCANLMLGLEDGAGMVNYVGVWP